MKGGRERDGMIGERMGVEVMKEWRKGRSDGGRDARRDEGILGEVWRNKGRNEGRNEGIYGGMK